MGCLSCSRFYLKVWLEITYLFIQCMYIYYTNSSEISTRNVDSQLTVYLLEGLTPHQLVGISISATTGGGEGPQSNYVYNTTEQTG